MAKASSRRTTKQSTPTVLHLASKPPAPHPHCQAVADGLGTLKNEALHGLYTGALVLVVYPDGSSRWDAFGTLGTKDNKTASASSDLTVAVYRDCWKVD